MCAVSADVDAQEPSVVPRTVIATGFPPRLAAASRVQEAESTVSSQPPDVAPWMSVVCAAHDVTIRQSVNGGSVDWLKSTSKRAKGAPYGTHCTESTLRFGGRSAASGGYTIWIGGVLDPHDAAVREGNV